MSYSKLHASIVGSSLWTQSDAVRILFITLLAIADRDGCIYGSRLGLARIANIDVDDVDHAFTTLMLPDEDSCDLIRAPENEGRRLEEISGGFRLLNYEYYRSLRNDDDRREQNKIAQQRYRERNKPPSAAVSRGKPRSAAASRGNPPKAYAEAEADTERTKPSARKARGALPNPAEVSKGIAETRHTRIQGMIMRAYQEQNGVECPWNGAEGKQLKIFLDKTPRWTDQQIAQCLMNLYASEGYPKSTEPKEFLTYLPKYLKGPLNQFNREQNNGSTRPLTTIERENLTMNRGRN